MATLDKYEAKQRLQDGALLRDLPRDHARWKLGKDTVREVTVLKWIKYGQLTQMAPGVWKWNGDEPCFISRKVDDQV